MVEKITYSAPEMIEVDSSASADCGCFCGLHTGGGSGSC